MNTLLTGASFLALGGLLGAAGTVLTLGVASRGHLVDYQHAPAPAAKPQPGFEPDEPNEDGSYQL